MQHLNRKKKQINQNLLDLFVGMDLEETKIYDGLGNLQGIHMQKLNNEASVFLSHLRALGVNDLPSSHDLIQSYFEF